TIISGPPAQMIEAVRLVAEMASKDNLPGARFVGLHIEGPFLSAIRRGGHAEENLRAPSIGETEALLAAGQGLVKIFTIAPELDGAAEVIALLSSSGVHVSAGHTD